MKTKMRYLVSDNSEFRPFITDQFDPDNFSEENEMIVFDLVLGKYTLDGKHWDDIEEDRL